MEGVDDHYRSEIAKALKARSAGNLQDAIKHFSAASHMQIFEFPNYALWPDLAELYCRAGQKSQGQALLADFTCAADIMAARNKCWLGKDGDTTHRNPAISSRCYRTVCGDMYVAYFGQEPGASIEYKSDREKISKVRKVCR